MSSCVVGSGSVCSRSPIRSVLAGGRENFFNLPDVVGDSGSHSRGNPQRLVDAAEIVIHEVQRNSVAEVFHLFGKSIGQPGEPPHAHAHGEVLALDKARRDVLFVGIAADSAFDGPAALASAVAALLLGAAGSAVELHQHGVVNFLAKGAIDRGQVAFVPVRSQLDAVSQSLRHVVHERHSGPYVGSICIVRWIAKAIRSICCSEPSAIEPPLDVSCKRPLRCTGSPRRSPSTRVVPTLRRSRTTTPSITGTSNCVSASTSTILWSN